MSATPSFLQSPTTMYMTRLSLFSIALLSNIAANAVLAAGPIAASFGRTLSSRSTEICADPPRDTCNFYADCLEARYKCGPNGYPIGYGQTFCEKFSDDRDELSPQGQDWMLNTMQCLQRELIPEATGSVPDATCDSISEKAFASHARCYVDNGLCDLSVSDWAAIVDIVGVGALLGSVDAFIESLKAAEGCFFAYLYFLAHLL